MKTMTVLGFIAVMAVTYFVVPIAVPSVELTLIQSAAITLLLFVLRAVLTEGITVKVSEMTVYSTEPINEEESYDDRY
ncbi:hypothetical protein DOE78_19025 [Bacillus sp. Y1]|nr:hypothetical protein [Bacillus sp. Y1]AYA77374.1 hypothetical protein DOE78_19025 [Bacillus sp. Y1]